MTSIVDIWSLLLDDSTIVNLITTCGNGGAPITATDGQFKSFLNSVSEQVFPMLFETLLNVYLFESVLTCDEEEDEEDAVIASRSVEDILLGVALLGRVAFVKNSTMLCGYLTGAQSELSQLYSANMACGASNNTRNLVALEKMRIALLFICYVYIDGFHELSENTDNESSTISTHILEAVYCDSTQTIGTLNAAVSGVVNLLQFQVSLLCSPNGVCNDLTSPMLLQLVYRFVSEYVKRYVDTDTSNYSREILHCIPQLAMIHGELTFVSL